MRSTPQPTRSMPVDSRAWFTRAGPLWGGTSRHDVRAQADAGIRPEDTREQPAPFLERICDERSTVDVEEIEHFEDE